MDAGGRPLVGVDSREGTEEEEDEETALSPSSLSDLSDIGGSRELKEDKTV